MSREHCQNPTRCASTWSGHCRACGFAVREAARLAKMRRPGKRSGDNVAVPDWVPLGLIEDYFDLAGLYGEEAAASFVRRLKREASPSGARTANGLPAGGLT